MARLLGCVAAAAAVHWKRSLAIVAVALVALIAAAQLAGGEFSDDFTAPDTESQAATEVLEERFPAHAGDIATVVFSVEDGTLRQPDRRDAIGWVVEDIGRGPHVTGVTDPFSREARNQVSRDGRIAYATVQYDEQARNLGSEPGERLERLAATAERAGVEMDRRGQIVDQAEQRSVPVGELVGVAVAVIVLRSVAAMAITLVSAVVALIAGLMLLTIGSAFFAFPTVAPTLGLMLGLGAGIDYALLIVGRYREQLAAGDSVPRAARVTGSTAGTSVLAAGAIVVVAISGLLVVGIPMLGRMGIGSAIVVATAAVGAVTVLPVITGAAARRLRPPKPTGRATGTARWDERLTAHPWRAAAAGGLVLLLLAVPFTSMRLGQPDDGNDASGSTTRRAYDKLAEGFGPGFNGPLVLAARLPAKTDGTATLRRVERDVKATPGVAAVSPARSSQNGDAATLQVIPSSSPQDERTSELVDRLRADVLPAATRGSGVEVYVGGSTAMFEDLADTVAASLPVFIALVVGLAVILLMAVFRSIWVPLVSALFNLLSIGAAYGVVVAVFQWGWGGSLLGVSGDVPIVSFVPMFMFAVLFGLSMDYNVFLQSRIREEYVGGLSARESVIVGLSRTTRIILGAGAIMTAVFLGFGSDPEVIVKTVGVGLASAILIDVLVVRLLVAPAVMTLLGDRAWWLPPWLDRILPRISLEGARSGS